jgi:exopolyphosphatase/guanosine-5'-triphosphate,3'-diphosphate pyrophosphatase
LAFRGATSWLDLDDRPVAVIDIGGGSTEFAVGGADSVQIASIDLGSVSLTEQELHTDPPRPEELANAIGRVADEVDDVVRAMPELPSARLIGVAGTITTVAAVELGLEPYDPERIHLFVLTRQAAEDVLRTLATERLADRIHNPGLQAERADIIVGGCCILVAIMRRLEATELVVSECDLLDGLLGSLV